MQLAAMCSFIVCSDHASVSHRAKSVNRRSRSRSVTEQGASGSANVVFPTRSRSLSSTERLSDNQRETVLLQHKLDDALRKLNDVRLALAAKVIISSSVPLLIIAIWDLISYVAVLRFLCASLWWH